jgi:hypothetical protein
MIQSLYDHVSFCIRPVAVPLALVVGADSVLFVRRGSVLYELVRRQGIRVQCGSGLARCAVVSQFGFQKAFSVHRH